MICLASLTGDHKLDVVAGVQYETSGFQEDHRSRSFLERSPGADDRYFAGPGPAEMAARGGPILGE